jgi:hypothetical protein
VRVAVPRVGLVPNTAAPLPVSSVKAEAKFAEVEVPRKVATPVASPETPVEIGNPVALVNVPEAGVPSAPPFTRILLPSIETTPALTLARVVSEALPSSIEPTPRAVEVEEVRPAIGRPVALVKVPEEGVPSAPPLVTKAPALPTLTPRAVRTPVPGAVADKAPVPPEVVTRPLVVRLERVEMF